MLFFNNSSFICIILSFLGNVFTPWIFRSFLIVLFFLFFFFYSTCLLRFCNRPLFHLLCFTSTFSRQYFLRDFVISSQIEICCSWHLGKFVMNTVHHFFPLFFSVSWPSYLTLFTPFPPKSTPSRKQRAEKVAMTMELMVQGQWLPSLSSSSSRWRMPQRRQQGHLFC